VARRGAGARPARVPQMNSPAHRGFGNSPLLVAAEVTRLRYPSSPGPCSEEVRASSRRLLLFKRVPSARSTKHVPVLVISLLLAACSPSPPPEPGGASTPAPAKADVERLRRALGNIESYLADLEGRLRISDAQTWSHEASAAQHDLGNIRIEIGTLKQGSQSVGNLESWLSDLEVRLQGANAENWSENASAAQHIVGNLRLELQTLSRRLQAVSDEQ